MFQERKRKQNMKIEQFGNGDFQVVYESSDPPPGKIEHLHRPENPEMYAEFARRCTANKQGHTGDVVAGR